MTSVKPSTISRNTTSKNTTSKTVVAIIAATMGLAALTPAANAAGPDRGWGEHRGDGRNVQIHREGRDGRNGGPRMMMAGRGGVLGLACGPNAAERMEHALVALKYRTNPTGDQVALFDTLHQAALDAQKEFATTCEATRPARGEARNPETRPNLLEAMQMRLKIDEARVAALGDVLPQFEAFFNSLTPEQQAALEFRGHRPGRGNGPDDAPKAGPGERNT
jgi:hypothetical protein